MERDLDLNHRVIALTERVSSVLLLSVTQPVTVHDLHD